MEQLAHLSRVPRVLMTGRSSDGEVHDFPVRLAVMSDDVGYFAVWSASAADKVLAEDSAVRFAFCNFRARPGGSDQPGVAVPADSTVARAALVAKWPAWFRAWAWARETAGTRLSYYRLVPAEEPTPWAVALVEGTS